MKYSLEEWASRLFIPLYLERYTQTLWNTKDPVKQKKGWRLKKGDWVPWFFNMRDMGDSPELFYESCAAMADMTSLHDDVDILIGVEMAGINLSGGMAVASHLNNNIWRRIGYTRPLPKKVRKPLEALELLRSIDAEVEDYGQKQYVEARPRQGDRIAIYDDMATDLGSKIIARLIVLWDAKQRGTQVNCNKIFYLLNRTKGNRQVGLDFAKEPERGLHPAVLDVNFIIEFDDYLPGLKSVMKEAEYEVIMDSQKNLSHYQDKDVQKEVLALAAKTR